MSTTPLISVILCTHNPREDYLLRTLDALKHQTLARDQWEFLLVDNASTKPVSDQHDVSWHPFGRHVREDTIGLTHARIRGIRDSSGPLLVFVDDDNILDRKYLETAVDIADKWFCLGVWGGNIDAEFETEPSTEVKPYLVWIAVIPVTRTHFTSEYSAPCPLPVGAGMCVRRTVAEKWAHNVIQSPTRLDLDRKGESLASCGDVDLRNEAIACGLGLAMFPELSLIHLIPSRRVQPDYLLRLCEESRLSEMKLAHSTGRAVNPYPLGILVTLRFYLGHIKRRTFGRRTFGRQVNAANRRASQRFRKWLGQIS
jgi:GT2 family glycosyltransferase